MTNKYFLYARKSPARGDRQVTSIPDQIKQMKKIAKKANLHIVEIIEESASAKSIGRPLFNQMMLRIQRGEANGILCWDANRLARNAQDAGLITDMLINGKIVHIKSSLKDYYPKDNIVIILMDFGIATQFCIDLARVVKRGIMEKGASGWLPKSIMPLGYKHNPERKTQKDKILTDPNTFDIVKELWRLCATGAYSLADLRDHAFKKELVNKKGKAYSINTLKRMFGDTFYAGYFFWPDEDGIIQKIDGKHKPMITQSQFQRVQEVLALRGRNTRSNQLYFAYRGILTCGECDGHITAELVHRVICTNCKTKFSCKNMTACKKCGFEISEMDNPSFLKRAYYRCVNGRRKKCSQKTLNEDIIEKTFLETLEKIEINEEVYNWAKNKLMECSMDDPLAKDLLKNLRTKRSTLTNKLDTLIEMRLSGEIEQKDTISIKERLNIQLKDIENEIIRLESQEEILREESHTYLDLARNCVERFKNANNFVKKEFINQFCPNPKIIDKTLYFSTKKAPKVLFRSQTT